MELPTKYNKSNFSVFKFLRNISLSIAWAMRPTGIQTGTGPPQMAGTVQTPSGCRERIEGQGILTTKNFLCGQRVVVVVAARPPALSSSTQGPVCSSSVSFESRNLTHEAACCDQIDAVLMFVYCVRNAVYEGVGYGAFVVVKPGGARGFVLLCFGMV